MMKRMRTKRMRMTVNNFLSLSSFFHGAVGLLDDEDENDKTLYQVFQWWNGDEDDEDIDNINWNTMLACAHECTKAVQRATQSRGQNEVLLEEVLPQKLLLHPHDGNKPLWQFRCHVSAL